MYERFRVVLLIAHVSLVISAYNQLVSRSSFTPLDFARVVFLLPLTVRTDTAYNKDKHEARCREVPHG